MRYMIIVKGSYEDEISPPANFNEMIVEMGRYNQELIDSGVMLAGEGLMPSSTGAKVQFAKGKPPTVKDGPFTEAKELVGGFWIIEAKDLDEAIGWAKKIPFDSGEVEVRLVSETSDFEANKVTGETLRREQENRDAGTWPRPKVQK